MESKTKLKLLEGAQLVKVLQKANVTIYPIVAPESAGVEYVVYRRTSLDGYQLKGRITPLQKASYTIDVVSDEYAKVIGLTQTVLDTLGDYSDTEILDINIDDLSEDYSKGFFIQTINITITI